MKKFILSICLPILLIASSCKPKQEIDYMKNIEKVAIETSQRQYSSTIQPADQLAITVLAKANEVAQPFNQDPNYLVDSNGNIDFPILGTLSTTDKTLENFKIELKEKLAKYIKNPGVNIRTLNYKVTVLGEVNKSGTYVLPEGQPTTILNVIGLAGHLTIYGKRTNVLLIRNVDGATTKHYVDLTNAEFLNSPEYYVRQNDVIYISPNKARKSAASYGPQTGIWISVASIFIGVLALIFRN